jgi:hypothetical protein
MFVCLFNTVFCALQGDQDIVVKAGVNVLDNLSTSGNKTLLNGSPVNIFPSS